MNLFKIFDATRKQREQIKAWAAKAGMDGEAIINKVESAFDKDAEQFAAARWIIKGYDTSTFKQALYICSQKHIDPMGANPEELVRKNPDIKPKEKAIDPDTVLTDRKDEGNGVVSYVARDEDREVLRQIINTHYGKDASPWCLLQGDGNGNLTSDSEGYWYRYSAYPKRVAFKDGKLLAFSAGMNRDVREWWDRMDRSFPFIPYDGKTWLGKNGNTYAIKGGDVIEIGVGDNRQYRSRLSRNYSTEIEMSDRDVYVRGDKLCNERDGILYDIVREDDKYYYVEGTNRYGTSRGQYAKDTLTEEGVFEVFGVDGVLELKETYKHGKKDGPYENYYGNGQLMERGIFKNGDKNGPFEIYYGNGKLKEKGTYKNGEFDGPCEYYYTNGQLSERCTYKNGKEEGPYESYYKNGKLQEKCTYKGGKYDGLLEEYHSNGQLYRRVNYKDGHRDGSYEGYYDNGQLYRRCVYRNNEKNGTYEKYYDNGQLNERCTYKNDAEEGLYERYYSNGQLKLKCVYKNGREDGPSEEYHDNGQLQKKCVYKDGNLVGLAEIYNTKGELVRRDKY